MASGTPIFPRLDPCVIGVVESEDGERILLAEHRRRPGFFTLVAGYVDVGESIEAAFAREVLEETGRRVGDVAYVESQPWPASGALMLGMTSRTADVDALDELIERQRVNVIDGDVEIDDTTSLHMVGGHSPGMTVVRVRQPGRTVVLASDASHFYENFEQDKPFAIVHELPAMYLAFDRLRELAGVDGVIVPGHDPRVAESHEVLSDERVIRLDGAR